MRGDQRVNGRADVALKIRDLEAGYNGRQVLWGVNVDLRFGALTGLIGPNGAGKSTLIKAVLGEVRAKGTLELGGRPLRDLRTIAYVPQRSGIDFTFPITVAEVAVQGTFASLPWWRRPGKAERDWALECLDAVGMADFHNHSLGQLSGGQAARVFIARALAQQPALYLLDEPFAAIDVVSEEKILQALVARRDAGDAVAIVHHNLDQVPRYFDDVIVLNETVVASGPVSTAFTPEVLADAFPSALALARLASGSAPDAGSTVGTRSAAVGR